MGLDFDLEEGNIKGVKEDKPPGGGGKVLVAAVVIVVLAAFFLWFLSNRSVIYSTLPAFGSSFGPITTGPDANSAPEAQGQESPAADAGVPKVTGNAGSKGTAGSEAAKEPLGIAFNAQLVSSDYSFMVSNTDIQIEGAVSGTTQSESFSMLPGSYSLKNFSGKIWTSKGFVELEGASDEFGTPIGSRKISGKVSITAESGVLAMSSVYLDSFSQTVTGSVATSTTTTSASGNFSLKGFLGKIVLGLNNSVTFEGRAQRISVGTTSAPVSIGE